MIKKVLVANRGEIAVRIIRSCREMGIQTVAVYSDADRKAMHVLYADEAYYIGPSPSLESYLNRKNIIEAAKASGADAIHPGYGFLSENAGFSERCQKEGIIFIGPSPYAISKMGDKITARKTMTEAGVPVVPGTPGKISSESEALKIIGEIGLPVMIKASAGGGGKGMRLVKEPGEIKNALRSARSEARTAFGDDSVFIEKYIESPHHIEFQILADKHGNVIHLFERECSVQRRHQKIIEETPSPILTEAKRIEMGAHAVAAAKAVDYDGAGTIEFIVDNDLNYYFLEMNTRLQVEHPITERVVGVDLVKEQINIANGLPLAFKQSELSQNGHAIECRVYAEDPENNFMPAPGKVSHIDIPYGVGVRVDGYIYEGFEIPLYYDPLIAKLIVWGRDRNDALERTLRAIKEFKVTGVKNNLKFLERIILADDFIKGNYNTHFIQENLEFLMKEDRCENSCEEIVMITALIEYLDKMEKASPKEMTALKNNWKDYNRVRNVFKL
ncbi:MAG: acetyl-CoA carboxylase biotin carboxylase subunit [Bacteroides sp.]|jgi:acetyl-CoA carboxylase biotin carboxylase subunit|nr:acetyl-CoA carboxylase biotin carboxylase subunit [Bacteroides sp.]